MKTFILSMAILLGASGFAAEAEAARSHGYHSYSIWVGHFRPSYSWRAVNRQELLVWSSSRKPYLVRLWQPVHELRFAQRIGLSQTAGRITKFDSVYIDGRRVPIASISRIDRKAAERLQRNNRKARAKSLKRTKQSRYARRGYKR